MRTARALLLVCLAVGLAAVWYASLGHRRLLEEAEERSLEARLEGRARSMADSLDASFAAVLPVATYDEQHALLRPAPPSEARPYPMPEGSIALFHLNRGDTAHALAAARTSAERALVLLRTGDLDAALREPALKGTELWYPTRLELFEGEPDLAWRDDVSALLGGPSHRFAAALLKQAGVASVSTPEERRFYAGLDVQPGVLVDRGYVYRFLDDNTLRRHPLSALETGRGPIRVQLPPPYDLLAVRGTIDSVSLDAQVRRARFFYALAALILLAGTVYAYLAIGRAARLAQAKSDFVANVTHELKTPLANIRLYAESLREGRVRDEDSAGFLDTILDESRRLDTLVEGLLRAARGPQVVDGRVDLTALLVEAERRWRPRLEREGYAFAVDAPELPSVRGDREGLLRALANLLDNARKYSTRDRRIELAGATQDGFARLSVRDHGPGIPVAARGRVLEPFTRLEGADTKETPGTGLGLSLVAACMEAHGGGVEIDGSTVTLVLPLETR